MMQKVEGDDAVTEKLVVIKFMTATYLDEEENGLNRERLVRETENLATFKGNDFIVNVLETIDKGAVVMQIADLIIGKELHELRENFRANISEVEGRNIAHKINSALVAIHAKGLVHRDLHPMNIMICCNNFEFTQDQLDNPAKFWGEDRKALLEEAFDSFEKPEDFGIKIIDFGFCKKLELEATEDEERKGKVQAVSSNFGSSMVYPPEQKKNAKYDLRIDVWYLGMTILYLYSNHKDILHNKKTHWSIASEIQTGKNAIEKNLQNVSIDALRFANKMLRFDYNERPSSMELLSDRYWTLDLEGCTKVGEILESKDNRDALFKTDLSAKGEKITILTKENNLEEYCKRIGLDDIYEKYASLPIKEEEEEVKKDGEEEKKE